MDLKGTLPRGLGLGLAGYSVFAGAAWALRVGPTSLGVTAVVLHILAAVALVVGSLGPGHGTGTSHKWWALLLPWLVWLLAWSEIGWLFAASAPRFHDGLVGQADLAVFGIHLNRELPRLLAGPVWREAMTAAYLSYYALVLGPPLWLALHKRWADYWRHTSGLVLTYLSAFTIYLVWPVRGPRESELLAGVVGEAGPDGFLPGLMAAVFAAGDSVGTAFPSSHCAGAAAAALLCCGRFGSKTERLIIMWAMAVVVSTIHTNNHYAIDALAGCVLAAGFHALGRNRARSDVSVVATVADKGEYHAKDSRHRRNRIYRPASRIPTGSGRSAAAHSGARSR